MNIEPMGARRDGQLLEQHMSEYEVDQIDHIQTPTLVLQAPDDTLNPFEQAKQIRLLPILLMSQRSAHS